jgi:hypothetical protein
MKYLYYLVIIILIYILIKNYYYKREKYSDAHNTLYISGELYKLNCKYNLDDRYPIIPYDNTINENDSVFLKISDINSFILNPPPVKVTLIVSNSDETFDDTYMKMVSPFVNKVYASNCSAKNAIQIPLGFRDDQYTPHLYISKILNDSSITSSKNIFCLLNFLIATNSNERNNAFNYFNNKSWVTVGGTQSVNSSPSSSYFNYNFSKSLDHKNPETIQKRIDYYILLKQSKFVICPPGAGVDTHRVYESLIFGAIPIIKTSFLDPMYKKLGGCWIVNDWSDVTEESCNLFYNNINRKIPNLSIFTMSYNDF